MNILTISVAQAAERLSLGRTSIYALINDGSLQTIKIGRRRLIKVESIKRLLEADS